jgi:hypothetical protein
MDTSSQKRALKRYRERLSRRGIARFEVVGRDTDRELIRDLARRLAEDGPNSARIRAAVCDVVSGEREKRGGILAALRESPMVGAELDLTRAKIPGRKIAL